MASQIPFVKFRGVDNAGNSAIGGKLFTYAAGTTTKTVTYADQAGVTPNTNPIILDARGECNLFGISGTLYKLVLSPNTDTDPPTGPYWTQDNISTIGGDSANILALYAASSGATHIGITQAGAPTSEVLDVVVGRWGVWAETFGAVGDGIVDDTTAIQAAYAYGKLHKMPFIIGHKTYRITQTITFDGEIDVLGMCAQRSVFSKDANIDGVIIAPPPATGQESKIYDFTVKATANDVTGRGIVVKNAAHLDMRRVKSLNNKSHGLHIIGASPTGFSSSFDQITLNGNGGDGCRAENCFNTIIGDIDTLGNIGWGWKHISGDYNVCSGIIVAQQNTGGGVEMGGRQNDLRYYFELNTGLALSYTSSANANTHDIIAIDNYPSSYSDVGTNNSVGSVGGIFPGYFARIISQPKRNANLPGNDVSITGGAAGSGATPQKGGTGFLGGGRSDGTGNLDGGEVQVRGGSALGTGKEGAFRIQVGGGATVIGSFSLPVNAFVDFQYDSTVAVNLMHRISNTQEAALTLIDGMGPWYNASLGKWRVRGSGATKSLSDYLSASTTYDPPNIGAASISAATTVSVSGAALGDIASASFSLDQQNLIINAWVSSANTVSVSFANMTGGAINLASGTLTVHVIKA